MTLYEESKDWCIEYAKTHNLKYRAMNDDGEKYFFTKEEAEAFFNRDIPKPYTKVTLVYKNEGDFVDISVQYR